MKLLVLITLLLFSSQCYAGWFSSKDKNAEVSKKVDDIISVKMEDGAWAFFPKDKLVLILTDDSVILAYGESDDPLMTYPFTSKNSARAFIESVYPDYKCLTVKGLVKCGSTEQLAIEE